MRFSQLLANLRVAALATLLAACGGPPESTRNPRFEWVEYAGLEPAPGDSSGLLVAAPASAPGTFRNPILPGFYPDPSLVRVESDYYLVNSTFSWFPGIPVHHSRDLVNWTPIGHVFDRREQLNLDSLAVSEGVFAPTIRYHDGTFYVVVTLVGAGGNVVVTAENPAGPWSIPVPLPSVDGIDPDLFFDDDGRAWIAHNGPPPAEPEWGGHRALWIQEFDPASLRMIGQRTLIVDGGVDPATHPVWIEGPHLIKTKGYYYLIAAEGGTAEGHSQVVFRGPSPTGPFTPFERNPILTQRDLPAGRPNPVTSTGHADFVQTPGGDWWAVFLGTRPYDIAEVLYNTGRETFLLPVDWSGEWPVILTPGEAVPLVAEAPEGASPVSQGASFDSFEQERLAPSWVHLRSPQEAAYRLDRGDLVLEARPDDLAGRGRPTLVARRQQHAHVSFTAAMRYRPEAVGDEAGLVAMQQDESWLLFTVVRAAEGPEIRLVQRWRGKTTRLAAAPIDLDPGRPVLLRFEARGAEFDFSYALEPDGWVMVARGVDATMLSTRRAGGFTGTMLGLFARAESE